MTLQGGYRTAPDEISSSRAAASARISTTASTCSRCTCRRCASVWRTSRCPSITSSRSIARASASTSRACLPLRSPDSPRTSFPATCASSRTRSTTMVIAAGTMIEEDDVTLPPSTRTAAVRRRRAPVSRAQAGDDRYDKDVGTENQDHRGDIQRQPNADGVARSLDSSRRHSSPRDAAHACRRPREDADDELRVSVAARARCGSSATT